MNDIVIKPQISDNTFGFGLTPILYKGQPLFFPSEIGEILEYSDINAEIRKMIANESLKDGIDTYFFEGEELVQLKAVVKSVQNTMPSDTFDFEGPENDVPGRYVVSLPNKLNHFRMVGESGLYMLIFRSSSSKAREFRKWVSRDVLPSIRKTGKYETSSVSSKEGYKEKAAAVLDIYMLFAEKCKIPEAIAQAEAAKVIENSDYGKELGIDLSLLVSNSPAASDIKDDEVMLEPTPMAPYFDLKSGKAMNKLLAHVGLQVWTATGWHLTEKGKKMAKRHLWKVGNKMGYNYQWKVDAVSEYIKGYLKK